MTACGPQQAAKTADVPKPVSNEELAKVTLKVGDQKGGTKSYLEAAGLLKDLPYKIEWSTFTAGLPLLEAANAGAIDVGWTGDTPPILSAAAKNKVRIVVAQQRPAINEAILVPPNSSLSKLEDLKGKRIGVTKGSSSHGVLLNALKKANLAPSDVTFSFLQPAEGYAAFARGDIDAWSIWDPYTTQALLENKGKYLVTGDGLTQGYNFYLAADQALADPGKNTALADFSKRVIKAIKAADANREQRAEVWSKETGLSLDVAKAVIQHGVDKPFPLSQELIDNQQKRADTLAEAKVIPTKITFGDLIDKRFESDYLAVK
ncbi:ABC transporter substrate-binding protein [Pseudonocardiaceae bacterium YIM PH 21723]|nr:ABC transporter substrate-binding protein [Pseudonocardiaceae bacterium YIM PH 21723]